MLFTDRKRSYKGRRMHAEPTYLFLERSARRDAADVRDLIEAWLDEVPDGERSRLEAHLRSGEEDRFRAAFFELYMHELLTRLGYSVHWHPDVGHPKGRSPEFLADDANAGSVIVEATTAADSSPAEGSSAPGMKRVYDAINGIELRHFWIDITEEGRPKRTPSAKRITRDLMEWLGGLDHSELADSYESGHLEGLPELKKTYDGWKLRFVAIPKPPEALADPDSTVILLHSFGVRRSNTKEVLKRAVKRKATRYGELGRPYIVAVSIEAMDVDERDIFEALIGSQPFVWDPRQPLDTGRHVLVHDGLWCGPTRPCNTRVSAVFIARNLTPWTVATCDVQLVLDPWAEHEVTGPIRTLPRREPGEDHWEFVEGTQPREVLGLTEGWPG